MYSRCEKSFVNLRYRILKTVLGGSTSWSILGESPLWGIGESALCIPHVKQFERTFVDPRCERSEEVLCDKRQILCEFTLWKSFANSRCDKFITSFVGARCWLFVSMVYGSIKPPPPARKSTKFWELIFIFSKTQFPAYILSFLHVHIFYILSLQSELQQYSDFSSTSRIWKTFLEEEVFLKGEMIPERNYLFSYLGRHIIYKRNKFFCKKKVCGA